MSDTPWREWVPKRHWNAEGIAILPSETQGIRKEPMTNAEMEAELKKIERQRTRDKLPLVNMDMIACAEKPQREAEAARTEGGAE